MSLLFIMLAAWWLHLMLGGLFEWTYELIVNLKQGVLLVKNLILVLAIAAFIAGIVVAFITSRVPDCDNTPMDSLPEQCHVLAR